MAGLEVTNFVLGLTTGVGRLVVDAAHHQNDKYRCALINADQVSHDTILFNFYPHDKDFVCTLELVFQVTSTSCTIDHDDFQVVPNATATAATTTNDDDENNSEKETNTVKKYMKEQSNKAKRDNVVIAEHNQKITAQIETLQGQLTHLTDGTLYVAILQHIKDLKRQKLMPKVARDRFDDQAVNEFARQRFLESGEVETLVHLMAGERLREEDVDTALEKFMQTLRQRGFECRINHSASRIKRWGSNIPLQRVICVTNIDTSSRPKALIFQSTSSALLGGNNKSSFDPMAQAQVLTNELVNDLVDIRNRRKELED